MLKGGAVQNNEFVDDTTVYMLTQDITGLAAGLDKRARNKRDYK